MDFTLVLLLGFPMTFWVYVIIEQITDWSIYTYIKRIIHESVEEIRIIYHRTPLCVFDMIMLFFVAVYIINYDSINLIIQNIMSLFVRNSLTPAQTFHRICPSQHTSIYAYKYAFVRRVPDIDEINDFF